jgi:hypothetical protein
MHQEHQRKKHPRRKRRSAHAVMTENEEWDDRQRHPHQPLGIVAKEEDLFPLARALDP